MKNRNVMVVHILREGNNLTNIFTNHVFFLLSTKGITYTSMYNIPQEAKNIFSMDRTHIPNLQLRKVQNHNHNIHEQH